MTMLGILLMNGISWGGFIIHLFLLLFEMATYAYLRADSAEGEQIASAHPVNSALRNIEVLRGRCRDGREGQPLYT